MAPLNLGSLSDELFLMVFNEVYQISTVSLLSICLVSHRFCGLATPLIYHRVLVSPNQIIDISDPSPEEPFYSFKTNIATYTRHVTVDKALDWPAFGKLLSKMQRLEEIMWLYFETPFPAIIKEILQEQPKVKLHIENLSIGYRTDVENIHKPTLDLLRSLISISSIHTVKVVTKYEQPVIMRWLKDVLLSSRNLEVLHITLPRNENGDIEWQCDGLGAYDLCVEDDEQLKSLTDLVYESRLADISENRLIPISFFDWPNIRHVELRGPSMNHYVEDLLAKGMFQRHALETFPVEIVKG